MRGVIPLVAMFLGFAAANAVSAYAVTVEQHVLPAEDHPATAILGSSSGILVAGPIAEVKKTRKAISFDIVHSAPFSISPGPEGHEAMAMAIGPTGEPWVLAQSEASSVTPTATSAGASAESAGLPAIFQANLQANPPTMRVAYRYPDVRLTAASSMVFGPEGALWIDDSSGGAIERLTSATGVMAVLPQPGADSVVSLATGDGAIWYADIVRGTIGEVTPNGEVTQHLIPGNSIGDWSYSEPYSVAVGPQGSIWFTEENRGVIGRMAPTGQVTEYAIPNPQHAPPDSAGSPMPRNIVAGHEGAIWFTDPGDDSIGRVTQSGEVTEYPIPRTGLAPSVPILPAAITVGPEGSLWFTEQGANALGSVNPTGVSTAAVAPRAVPRKRGARQGTAACDIPRRGHVRWRHDGHSRRSHLARNASARRARIDNHGSPYHRPGVRRERCARLARGREHRTEARRALGARRAALTTRPAR